MGLILHPSSTRHGLSGSYQRAFANATELIVVSAYLTEWDDSLKLNPGCRKLRFIVGKDFGITRKAACEAVLRWLDPRHKANFRVTEGIDGFHPKAVFWKESTGRSYAIVGSSNLTRAAFDTNYEANIHSALSEADYSAVLAWLKRIEAESIGVSEWLPNYQEARLAGGPPSWRKRKARNQRSRRGLLAVNALELPHPRGTVQQISKRREMLQRYARRRAGLMQLFRQCANGKITSKAFYRELPRYWGYEQGNRMQGSGWERLGKGTDFRLLAQSFVRILDAPTQDRDDVVAAEIDRLHERGVGARRSFLSEMLCLRFPDMYPLLDKPVSAYLADVGYRRPRKLSEGARYVDLARRLRRSLQKDPTHPAKNLAELDTVIWLKYHD
jgi:hypothetical protein